MEAGGWQSRAHSRRAPPCGSSQINEFYEACSKRLCSFPASVTRSEQSGRKFRKYVVGPCVSDLRLSKGRLNSLINITKSATSCAGSLTKHAPDFSRRPACAQPQTAPSAKQPPLPTSGSRGISATSGRRAPRNSLSPRERRLRPPCSCAPWPARAPRATAGTWRTHIRTLDHRVNVWSGDFPTVYARSTCLRQPWIGIALTRSGRAPSRAQRRRLSAQAPPFCT